MAFPQQWAEGDFTQAEKQKDQNTQEGKSHGEERARKKTRSRKSLGKPQRSQSPEQSQEEGKGRARKEIPGHLLVEGLSDY